MRRLPPPLSVTLPPPSITMRGPVSLTIFAVCSSVIVTGSAAVERDHAARRDRIDERRAGAARRGAVADHRARTSHVFGCGFCGNRRTVTARVAGGRQVVAERWGAAVPFVGAPPALVTVPPSLSSRPCVEAPSFFALHATRLPKPRARAADHRMRRVCKGVPPETTKKTNP